MVRALGYLEIGVSNLPAWRAYARDVLGVAAIDDGSAVNLRYDDDCWRLRLLPTGEDDVRCVGFDAGSRETLEAIGARLADLGVEVTPAPAAAAAARGVEALTVCKDPFGLPVELYVGDRAIAEPFASPRGVSGFVTGDQGLGHIVLTVADAAKAEAFYMRGLGFLLSDHVVLGPPGRQLRLTFMHCNPRHHTLAIAPVPAPKRLNHIMLQLASFDDVGCGFDAARAAGVEISTTLGKHTNDRMISFYMRTPSGFDVEYGYGGIQIDDATWEPTTHHATSIWGHKAA